MQAITPNDQAEVAFLLSSSAFSKTIGQIFSVDVVYTKPSWDNLDKEVEANTCSWISRKFVCIYKRPSPKYQLFSLLGTCIADVICPWYTHVCRETLEHIGIGAVSRCRKFVR